MRAVVHDSPALLRPERKLVGMELAGAVIDRRYPLADLVAATRDMETGQKTGNVVLTLGGAELDGPDRSHHEPDGGHDAH
jgi:hypothetical protein